MPIKTVTLDANLKDLPEWTEEEYRLMLAVIDLLMPAVIDPRSPLAPLLTIAATCAEEYEQLHFPLGKPPGV